MSSSPARRIGLIGLIGFCLAGCGNTPGAGTTHGTTNATTSTSATTGTGTNTGSGTGSTGSGSVAICGACSSNADCASGYCDGQTHNCNTATRCTVDTNVCPSAGFTCDSNSGNCVCPAVTTSSSTSNTTTSTTSSTTGHPNTTGSTSTATSTSSSTSSTSSSSSSTGTSGTTSSCDCSLMGCENLGELCDPTTCACYEASSSSSSGTTGSTGSTGSTSSTLCTTQRCVVYAQTAHELYQVDPTNPGSLQQLCSFNGALSNTTADAVNDIAVQTDGTLWVLTNTDLYTVDPTSCAATHVSALAGGSNATFRGMTFNGSGELLVANASGEVYSIDTSTGAQSNLGSFSADGGLGCSGDLVVVHDPNSNQDVIYATAQNRSNSSQDDRLVSLDPTTFRATTIGSGPNYTGYKGIFGLGFWGGTLYGFDKNGNVLQIDPTSGVASLLATTSPADVFYGAGTTPLAPVITH